MATRYFALVYGIVFLLVGIAGFIPALVTGPEGAATGEAAEGAADAAVAMEHGRLFGLFAINPLHNIVHIAFGIWGLAAYYRGFGAARLYARAVAVIYAVLGVVGLIPGLNTLWGLVPLYGHDVWLHFVLAAVAAYFGWGMRGEQDVRATDMPR